MTTPDLKDKTVLIATAGERMYAERMQHVLEKRGARVVFSAHAATNAPALIEEIAQAKPDAVLLKNINVESQGSIEAALAINAVLKQTQTPLIVEDTNKNTLPGWFKLKADGVMGYNMETTAERIVSDIAEAVHSRGKPAQALA